MKLDIEDKEVILMLGLIEHTDPTGFYAGNLHKKLKEQLLDEQDRLQKEGTEIEEVKEN